MTRAYVLSHPYERFGHIQQRLPKLGLLGAITLAWVLTLAWPPPRADIQPILASGQTATAQYPVRVALPDAQPLPTEQLEDVIREHKAGATPSFAEAESLNSGRNDSQAIDQKPTTEADQLAALDLAPGEVLAINYDLTNLEPAPEKVNREDGSLTVDKQLYVDGVSIGQATIRIESGANILISTTSVAQALGDRADALPRRISSALATNSGFIPFYELRGAGIGVSYDPITDRVSLSTAS